MLAYQRRPGLVHRTLRGRTEVLRNDEIVVLDGAASVVWSVLADALDRERVLAAVVGLAGGGADRAVLDETLELLVDAALVVASGDEMPR